MQTQYTNNLGSHRTILSLNEQGKETAEFLEYLGLDPPQETPLNLARITDIRTIATEEITANEIMDKNDQFSLGSDELIILTNEKEVIILCDKESGVMIEELMLNWKEKKYRGFLQRVSQIIFCVEIS